MEIKAIFQKKMVGVFTFIVFVFGSLLTAGVFAQQRGADTKLFQLLEEGQEGIVYLRDPCQGNTFSLIFSFSEDLEEPSGKELAFIDFSNEFQDLMRSLYEGIDEVALYYGAPEKIGNRQIKVDYVVKKISMENVEDSESEIELPDQIEVIISNEDLEKIYSQDHHPCQGIDVSQRNMTLINKNSQKKCL